MTTTQSPFSWITDDMLRDMKVTNHSQENRDEPPHTGPNDPTHRAVNDVVKGLINDVIHPSARKQLSDALARPRTDPPKTATHKAPAGGPLSR